MNCQSLDGAFGPARRWHRIFCRECRRAARPDAVLIRGIKRLAAEASPEGGLEGALTAFGIATAARPVRSRRWKSVLTGRLLPGGSLTAAAALGAFCWLTYIDVDPNVAILQAPHMPAPNAFDTLRQAALAIPASEHKPAPYTEAGHNYTETVSYALDSSRRDLVITGNIAEKIVKAPVFGDNDYAYTLQDKERILTWYAPTLILARKSFQSEYHARTDRSLNSPHAYLADDWQIGRVFALDAQVKMDSGDTAGAVDSWMDTLELGAQMTRGDELDVSVGLSVGALGRSHLWKAIDRLDAAQAKAAAGRIHRIRARQASYADVLTEEKWQLVGSIQELMRSPQWRSKVIPASTQNGGAPLAGIASYIWLARFSKRAILDDVTRTYDHQIALARQPYTDAPPNHHVGDDMLDMRAAADPVVAMFAPSSYGTYFRDIGGSRAQLALLETSFALRAYKLEHGHLPPRLSALVTGYLPAVPEDPFDNGRLRYQPRTVRAKIGSAPARSFPILYSVGPDGKDDGGRWIDFAPRLNRGALEQTTRQPAKVDLRQRYTINPSSHGDIVAGINTEANP